MSAPRIIECDGLVIRDKHGKPAIEAGIRQGCEGSETFVRLARGEARVQLTIDRTGPDVFLCTGGGMYASLGCGETQASVSLQCDIDSVGGPSRAGDVHLKVGANGQGVLCFEGHRGRETEIVFADGKLVGVFERETFGGPARPIYSPEENCR